MLEGKDVYRRRTGKGKYSTLAANPYMPVESRS